jgi:enoyl-CoA hydratase
MSYTNILTETQERVAIIRLNRPHALNALNDQLMDELGAALLAYEADANIGCIIITGSEKAFAAGADIAAMANYSYSETYQNNYISRNWEQILQVRKPVIAAVAGYALGGGCELAMMCDFIIAAENARFGQPEIKLGTMPGAGGTQRLPRAVSKSLAMDLCLTGRNMNADEALRAGLVSRVVPLEKLMEEVLAAAVTIAAMSGPAAMMIKEAINQSYESGLSSGMHFERRMFQSTFGTPDQKEGMKAFLEKRLPKFR